jgi:hypothetical protein
MQVPETLLLTQTYKKPQMLAVSYLLLLAFATTFFSRILETVGAPSVVNFVHFATIPLACAIALFKTTISNRNQINTCYSLLFGLFFFLTVDIASAFLNSAGLVNIALDTLLLIEPFLLLVGLASLPLSIKGLARIRTWFEGFVFVHLLLIYIQKFALNYCGLPGECDNVQGIFYHSGSGHVVGASVSASFAIYYFAIAQSRPLWIRAFVLVAGLGNILTSDAKQVLLSFMVAFAVLALSKKDIAKSIGYLIAFAIFLFAFSWAIQNVEALSAFNTWIRPEIYGVDGEATKMKISGIRIVLAHFWSPLNWLLGLGPGHTIDRLGGWMIRDYSGLLLPLGATETTIGYETWQYVAASWLAEGSSMFSPFWGWAAIWGDIGILGLIAYLYLGFIVWRKFCLDDMSRFLLLTIMVHGFIFTQLEEPSYMLSMAMMIGIRWYEQTLAGARSKSGRAFSSRKAASRHRQLPPPTGPVVIP